MTRVHQGASLLILSFAVWVMVSSMKLNYWTPLGPGPGFFPFWMAILMAALSIVWFVQLIRQPVEGKASDFVPSRSALLRIGALILSVAIFGLLVDKIGFSIVMFVFLLFLLLVLGRQTNIVLTLVISFLGSFGVYFVFTRYLGLRLPPSSIEFLRYLGF